MLLTVLLQTVNDSGPIYKETVMGRFPVEPFNTASNLVFLAVIIYFSIKIWKSTHSHYFLKAIMPIFFLGYIGGTVYHATRSAEFWLLLDWVPIVLLCFACSIYFVFKSARSWRYRLLLIAIIVGLNIIPATLPLPKGYGTSVGYIGSAVAVILPVVVYLYQTGWARAIYLGLAVGSFTIAVILRTLDKKYEMEWLWMGTHWLWHTFGAIAVFWLVRFIYEDIERQQHLRMTRIS
ncbi:membrane protein [Nonlabens marinus]|uniref:Hemolysin III n=1 Tax=Nonlabens marinus S1-08 TaxID=1454201 RepID=W8VUN8_9FLAO|nr:membrane protein [Nonlabens marinus]BAO54743.1 hypothetical protein NMS_0734 [Nonlabens marinus S1-08]